MVIVEGESDAGVVEAIFSKLPREGRGLGLEVYFMSGNRLKKVPDVIRARSEKYDGIILLKDLHTLDEGELRSRIERTLSELPENLSGRVDYVIVRRSIEAWILADPDGLERATGHRPRVGDPEGILDPAEVLDELLKRCGKRYIKSRFFARRLAESIDLDRASRSSESLAEFVCKLSRMMR